jgi:hypothetical protein
VKAKTRLARKQGGALRVAELMYESVRKLPEEERQARVKAMQKIKISRSVLAV